MRLASLTWSLYLIQYFPQKALNVELWDKSFTTYFSFLFNKKTKKYLCEASIPDS